jgi:hypothetical protein
LKPANEQIENRAVHPDAQKKKKTAGRGSKKKVDSL